MESSDSDHFMVYKKASMISPNISFGDFVVTSKEPYEVFAIMVNNIGMDIASIR